MIDSRIISGPVHGSQRAGEGFILTHHRTRWLWKMISRIIWHVTMRWVGRCRKGQGGVVGRNEGIKIQGLRIIIRLLFDLFVCRGIRIRRGPCLRWDRSFFEPRGRRRHIVPSGEIISSERQNMERICQTYNGDLFVGSFFQLLSVPW